MSQQWDFGPIPSYQPYTSLLLNCVSANSLRSHHTAASWPGKLADKSFNPLTFFRARARRTNGAAVPLYIHSLPNIVTDVPKIPVKQETWSQLTPISIATRMPQLAMKQNFCAFPVGERPWSALSENVPPARSMTMSSHELVSKLWK